jgi:hypothetical protein
LTPLESPVFIRGEWYSKVKKLSERMGFKIAPFLTAFYPSPHFPGVSKGEDCPS